MPITAPNFYNTNSGSGGFTGDYGTWNMDRAARSAQELGNLNLFDPAVMASIQSTMQPYQSAQLNQFYTGASGARNRAVEGAGQSAGANAAFMGLDPNAFAGTARLRAEQGSNEQFFQGLAGLTAQQLQDLINALTQNQQFKAGNLQSQAGIFSNISEIGEGRRQFDEGQSSFLESFLTSAASGAGAAAISLCWIAEAIYGKDDNRTHLARYAVNFIWPRTKVGRMARDLYLRYGEKIAKKKWVGIFRPIFELIWRQGYAEILRLRVQAVAQ